MTMVRLKNDGSMDVLCFALESLASADPEAWVHSPNSGPIDPPASLAVASRSLPALAGDPSLTIPLALKTAHSRPLVPLLLVAVRGGGGGAEDGERLCVVHGEGNIHVLDLQQPLESGGGGRSELKDTAQSPLLRPLSGLAESESPLLVIGAAADLAQAGALLVMGIRTDAAGAAPGVFRLVLPSSS